MRYLTEIENQNESFLKERNIHFAKVLMTENILSHHIFDVTQDVVRFLKEEDVHNFDLQKYGEKTYITSHLLTFKRVVVTNTSVYKAKKRGDKRMWFGSEIIPLTAPNDIYLILAKAGELYILNMSHIDIMSCCTTDIDNPIKRFINGLSINNDDNNTTIEPSVAY